MTKRMKYLLPTGIVTKIAYVGNKLSTCFRVKDVTEFKHNHDIICQGICPKIRYNDHYLGETSRRISIEKGYKNDVTKRKVTEPLLIKEMKLNKRHNLIELKLLN